MDLPVAALHALDDTSSCRGVKIGERRRIDRRVPLDCHDQGLLFRRERGFDRRDRRGPPRGERHQYLGKQYRVLQR